MKLSPIIFFVCNRPNHTLKVLSSLKKNKLSRQSKIIIYIDKPKHKKDLNLYNEVVQIIKNEKNFKSKEIILRRKNYGLAKNFITGIRDTFKKYEKAIILEDDNLVSPYFLDFMNTALEVYKEDKKISSVYAYFPKTKIKLPETFFLKGSWTFTWGTGIWKRSWKLFEADAKKLLKKIEERGLKKEFNFDNSYDWYSMLERCKNGQNQSWSVRWYASTFLDNSFTLFPKYPLCKNIGMDGSGVNTPATNIWDVALYKKKINVIKKEIAHSQIAYISVKFFFNSLEPNYIKIYNYIKKKIYSLFYF